MHECRHFHISAIVLLWAMLLSAVGGAVSAAPRLIHISGTITDAATGETMVGATVWDSISRKGTTSNVYGFFSLAVPAGNVAIRVSYVGYQSQSFSFLTNRDTILNVRLQGSLSLKTVVITAEREHDLKGVQMSTVDIPLEHIKSMPVLFGEADVVKTVQLMPGVQSGGEGTTGMYVRGGGPDENLYLLDGIPMYNVDHAFGFFSAFNPDAIKNITLYKGSFPARFSGRLSSILDVYTNNGNDKSYHGSASIGAIAAKISVEGPIIKEKTTFNFSARRTYLDIFTRPAIKIISESDIDAGYNFYDINGKITHKFNDRSRLFANFYLGNDVVSIGLDEGSFSNMDMRYVWGNIVGSLRWNYMINSKLFSNLTASYTRYKNNIIFDFKDNYGANTLEFQYKSGIQDLALRADFDYLPTDRHSIKFGTTYTFHTFTPDVLVLQSTDFDTNMGADPTRAHELNAYAEDNWEITSWLKANIGLNGTLFHVNGTTYTSLQPRVGLRFLANEHLSFKTGYAHMTQYIHLLSTSNVSMPNDLWVPATEKVQPMTSDQVAAGAFYNIPNVAELSAEAYYKYMTNLVEYKDGASFMFADETWDNMVCSGNGWSYGIELMARRTVGKITGWLAYTWSKTERLFDREGQTLNGGKVFPAKYDRRHDVSVVLSYKVNQKIDLSATWVFSTGNAMTLGLQNYKPLADFNIDYLTYIESRNNYRMPNYHRLDFSANFNRQFKHGSRTINISIYNVYNRQNPYMLYQNGSGTKLKQLSVFQLIPSIAYTYKF